MNILRLEKADSTNTWVSQHENEVASPAFVYCMEQTAGRGQRGNSWESQPGKNITASVIFHPHNFNASQQFAISEAIALAIVDFLKSLEIDAKIKWPNDIYVGDQKICGILVEHVVTGKNISRTIAGFGININQENFYSDAPNPVSAKILTGKEYNLELLIPELANSLENYIIRLSEPEIFHDSFLSLLWRGDGNIYNFFDRIRNEKIKARIDSVGKEGVMTLSTEKGEKRTYAFKEVEFILE